MCTCVCETVNTYFFFFVAGVRNFIPPDLSVHPTYATLLLGLCHEITTVRKVINHCLRTVVGAVGISLRANWPGHPILPPKKKKKPSFQPWYSKVRTGEEYGSMATIPHIDFSSYKSQTLQELSQANDLSIPHCLPKLFECKTIPHISIYQFTKKTNQTEIQMHECIQIYNKSFLFFFCHFNSSERPTYRELFPMKPQICTKCQK